MQSPRRQSAAEHRDPHRCSAARHRDRRMRCGHRVSVKQPMYRGSRGTFYPKKGAQEERREQRTTREIFRLGPESFRMAQQPAGASGPGNLAVLPVWNRWHDRCFSSGNHAPVGPGPRRGSRRDHDRLAGGRPERGGARARSYRVFRARACARDVARRCHRVRPSSPACGARRNCPCRRAA